MIIKTVLRLYYPSNTLALHQPVPLDDKQSHYAMNVLRLKEGDTLRMYNSHDGEFEGVLQKISKKTVSFLPNTCIRLPLMLPKLGLAFALIKNDRQSFLVEKAVELGVTDLFPLQTAFTQTSKASLEKIHDQCVNASQQCERTDIPVIHPLKKLSDCLDGLTESWLVYAAIERMAKKNEAISSCSCKILPPCLVVGPEGGWRNDEKTLLLRDLVVSLDLGPLILRAETAAIVGLSMLKTTEIV